ncbi:MAG: M6 family metalloprotease domain-containing protein [Bacteroidales bacterium]|nr:M6 family metalloprotease domain-containing protein [Bacteroidales bacterium]
MKKLFLLIVLLIGCFFSLHAAYLENVPRTFIQPNGDTLHCFATGDEYYNYLHDAEGYTIVLDPSTGFYVYADKVNGALVPTVHVAGRVNPASVGLTPYINITAAEWQARRQAREAATPAMPGIRSGRSNHGRMNNLVVFIRFADDGQFTNNFNTVEAMFNDSTGTRQSMYSYFKSVTYNQLEIHSTFYPIQTGDVILSYQDSYSRNYFQPQSAANPNGYPDGDQGVREHALLKRAINAIASQVPADLDIDYDNDGYVDNVVFVVKGDVGDWNDLLWPHRWSLYGENVILNGKRVWAYNLQLSDNTYYFSVSTLCHEMNHSLGAPDLYHYYEGTSLTPVGSWDLMASNGNPPQNMNAYMKYKYGTWIDSIPEITMCGTYTLYPLAASSTQNCYKIASPRPHEYYVLEYRRSSDFYDSSIPGTGLLIYRINDRFDGNAYYDGVDNFDEIYVYRPGGSLTGNGSLSRAAFSANTGRSAFHAATDPAPYLHDGWIDTNIYIHQISMAGGDSIQFNYCATDYMRVSDHEVTVGHHLYDSASFVINSDLSWTISYDCDWLEVTPVADSGTVTVNLVALVENDTYDEQECVLTVTASNGFQQQVVVTQSGIPIVLSLTANSVALASDMSDSICVNLSCNTPWELSVYGEWVDCDSMSGVGDTSFYVKSLLVNDTCRNWYGYLRVETIRNVSATLNIRQNGINVPLEISEEVVDVPNVVGEIFTFQVQTTSTWTVSTQTAWLSFSPASGAGNATVTVFANATNTSGGVRTGRLQVSGPCGDVRELLVRQGPAFFSLSDNEIFLLGEAGSSAGVDVHTSSEWRVAQEQIPEWLQVTPMTGQYDGHIEVTALSSNEDEGARTVTLRVFHGSQFANLVVTQGSVGINEYDNGLVSVYPNPTSGKLNVDLSRLDSGTSAELQVCDMYGRVLKRLPAVPSVSEVDLSTFSQGIYFLRVISEETQSAVKILKQ